MLNHTTPPRCEYSDIASAKKKRQTKGEKIRYSNAFLDFLASDVKKKRILEIRPKTAIGFASCKIAIIAPKL